MADSDVFSTAFSTSALEARSYDSQRECSSARYSFGQMNVDQFWELDTDPVIPWPERLNDQSSTVFEFGGKGWGDLETIDGCRKSLDDSFNWCRSQYIEALYMPETIYSFSFVFSTFQRFALATALDTSSESFKNMPSPLSALMRTISDLSQKYKRTLPPLLSSLINPSSTVLLEESDLERIEWAALRAGLGLFLGSQGEKEKEIRRRKEKEKEVGEEGEELEKKAEEEDRRNEQEKEERWIEKGKKWLERLERRETLLQIIIHLLLLPPPSSSPSPTHTQAEPLKTQPDSTPKPKKRSRSSSKPSKVSSKKLDPVSKSLDQLTDRLSVWQALGSLGVEEAGTGEAEKDRQRDLSNATGNGHVKRKEVKEERDWVRVFWEDVVEKHFSQTHKHILPLLRSKLNFPPLTKTSVSRLKSTSQPNITGPSQASASNNNKSSSVALISSSSSDSILNGEVSTLATGKSRTKPLAKQLPSSANANVRLDFARSKSSSSRSSSSASLSSLINPNQHSAQDSLSRRAHTSSHYTLGLTRSASNLSLSSSTSASTSFGPRAGFARSGSISSITGGTNGSNGRANSVGPETKAEKLMRRSVSFSRGASVGRKGSSDAETGTGMGFGDKVEASGKKKIERVNSVGGRTLMASNSFTSSTSTLPARSGPSVYASLNQRNNQSQSQSQSQPQTLVPATPTKPVPSTSHSAFNLTQPLPQPAFAPESPEFMGETPPRPVRSSGLISESQQGQPRFGGKGLFGSIVVGTPDEEEDEEGGGMMDLFVIGTDDEGDN